MGFFVFCFLLFFLLSSIHMKIGVIVCSGEDMKEMEEDEDWQFVTIGDQVKMLAHVDQLVYLLL